MGLGLGLGLSCRRLPSFASLSFDHPLHHSTHPILSCQPIQVHGHALAETDEEERMEGSIVSTIAGKIMKNYEDYKFECVAKNSVVKPK